MTVVLERQAAVTGVGQSEIGRRLGRDPLELTLDACIAAIEDAGLTRADIDGLATYPGAMGGAPGFTGAGVSEVHDALRLKLEWFSGGLETSGQLGSVINACLAVACGLAKHVLDAPLAEPPKPLRGLTEQLLEARILDAIDAVDLPHE